MTKPTVWLIGDHKHSDFAAAVAWLDRHAAVCRHASPADALRAVDRLSAPPTAILFAVARPGRFAAAEIERVHRCEPLVPLVSLVGSLCEGEIRSGSPWPGVTRIYFHQWQGRLARALGVGSDYFAENTPSRTFSVIDEGEQLARAEVRQSDSLIAIRTATVSTFETLADACSAAGYRSVWLPPHLSFVEQEADVILTDESCGPLTCSTAQNIPRVVLLNFPRREDIDRALAAGAAAVVAKPFQLVDLWSALEVAVSSSNCKPRVGAGVSHRNPA